MKLQLLLKPPDQLTLAVVTAVAIGIAAFYCMTRSQQHLPAADRTARLTVDINQAEWTEIALLPGIGENLARAIVERREEHGPFASLQQLQEIDGIGPIKLESMQPFLLPLEPDRQRLATAHDVSDPR